MSSKGLKLTFLAVTFILQSTFNYAYSQEKNLLVCKKFICYTIKKGDTLYQISREFNVSLDHLIKANRLSSNLILPGEVLIIPDQYNNTVPEILSRSGISRDDLILLARAIYAEARGENFTGQVAVGAVILNRVKSAYFPNTIREVIIQRNKYIHQFTPVADGSINLEPNEIAINAAIQALTGKDPTNGALFFYNPYTATDKWIRTLPVITQIGNHVFATKA